MKRTLEEQVHDTLLGWRMAGNPVIRQSTVRARVDFWMASARQNRARALELGHLPQEAMAVSIRLARVWARLGRKYSHLIDR